MKLLFKILAYITIVIFSLIIGLFLIAELAENKVTKIALDRFNDGIDGTIEVRNVDFSLLNNFPFATVDLQDVSITTKHDTLAHVRHIFVSVETMPLLDSQFKIKEISVEGGLLNYHINKDGSTNFDIFIAETEEQDDDTTSESIYLQLDNLKLNNLFCSFKDESNAIEACLYIDEADANVQINELNQIAAFKGTLRANNCHYPASNLVLMEETKVSMDLTYYNDLINIKDIFIETDGASLKASGQIKQGTSFETDVHISSSHFDLNELKKYIPDSLLNAYGIRNLAGIASAQAKIKGLYNDSTIPSVNAWFQLQKGSIEIVDYPTVNHIKLSAKYSNGELRNNQTTTLDIDTLSFASGQSNGFIAGSIANLDAITYSVNSKLNLNLKALLNHMPDSGIEDLGGKLALQMSTEGQLPGQFDEAFTDYLLAHSKVQAEFKNMSVKLDSTLSLKNWNGHLSYRNKQFAVNNLNGDIPNYPLSIKNISMDGRYSGSISNFKSIGIDISNLDIKTAESSVKGSGSIRNLEYPNYTINANTTINLAEFKPFAPTTIVKDISGIITSSLVSEGTINLDSITDQAMAALFTKSKFNTSLDDVQIAMHDSLIKIDKLSGQFTLKSDSLNIENLSGQFSDIAFGTKSANIINIYNAFWLNQADTIKVNGNFELGDIDYALVEAFMAEDSTQSEPTTANIEQIEPSRYQFHAKGKITANSFKFNKAMFTNLSALYNVSDSLYIVDQIKFDAFKGSTNSAIKVQMLANNVMKVNFRNKVDKMDINQLLVDLDNLEEYGNDGYISHEQLSGNLSTENLNGYILFKDSLITDSIMMSADLKLEEGQLTNYPIAAEMGKDYGIDGLDNLKFKTIDTKMFVSAGAIYAPLTNVKTNTFDISLFGMQNFNLDCQYHLRFYLKEILRKGKTDRIKKKQSNEKKKKDDGGTKGLTSLYAIYKVENEKTVKSTLEGKDSKARQNMKININLQEALLKLSFHPKIISYKTHVEDN